jgi:hypothetical protein
MCATYFLEIEVRANSLGLGLQFLRHDMDQAVGTA